MAQPASEGNTVERRLALAREWEDLVEQIRGMDGFEDFLRPPSLDHLLPAAERGPVVLLNVSQWRCDALIVRPDGVTPRDLPKLTLAEATARAHRYLEILRAADDAHARLAEAQRPVPGETPRAAIRRQHQAAHEQAEAYDRADAMLLDLQAWMWDAVAGPVLDELGWASPPAGEPSSWPRVWWCPTGPLTVLPLHIAAPRHDPRTGVLDRVVSSYTPTLRALLEARRPAGDRDGTSAGEDRLLLVDVPDLPGHAPIDNGAERDALLAAFPAQHRTVLDTARATPEAVRAALPGHRWVHFSCHGDQDLNDPSRGGLLLRDGMLTVADITVSRFRGDFAGLSACKTAIGGVELLDEAITLAAALHFTGYRHVIAALWSVDNQASAEVFSSLYRTIAADGRLDPDRAPAALQTVVRTMRDRWPRWPHRWALFTHTGP